MAACLSSGLKRVVRDLIDDRVRRETKKVMTSRDVAIVIGGSVRRLYASPRRSGTHHG
jgi:hypothetical protein